MTDDPTALRAAADQGHAAVEEQLDRLLRWWTEEARPGYDTIAGRADEVAVLTHILTISGTTRYAALLAAALCRLAENPVPDRAALRGLTRWGMENQPDE